MSSVDVWDGSVLLAALQTLRRWAEHSVVVDWYRRERVQLAVVGLAVLVSVAYVHVTTDALASKFLSFLLVAGVTAAVTWPMTAPRAD